MHLLDAFKINPCVIGLSTGRCGTMTLTDIFKDAPEAFVYHEPGPQMDGGLNTFYGLGDIPHNIDNWLKSREALLVKSILAKKGYVELGGRNAFRCYEANACLPHCKFLHIVRDPRAFIRSCMRRKWYTPYVGDRREGYNMSMFPNRDDPDIELWPK